MRHIAPVLTVAAVAALALSGCVPQPAAKPDPATESATPTPTPTPTELVLTTEEAGSTYLDLVCDVNTSVRKVNDAFSSVEDEFLNGGAPDPTAVKAAAGEQIAMTRAALAILDDDFYVWPEVVREPLSHIRTDYIGLLSYLDAVVNATSYEDAYYAPMTDPTPEQTAAGQEIRYSLGLSTDTVASCAGHEGKLTELHEQLAARNGESGS